MIEKIIYLSSILVNVIYKLNFDHTTSGISVLRSRPPTTWNGDHMPKPPIGFCCMPPMPPIGLGCMPPMPPIGFCMPMGGAPIPPIGAMFCAPIFMLVIIPGAGIIAAGPPIGGCGNIISCTFMSRGWSRRSYSFFSSFFLISSVLRCTVSIFEDRSFTNWMKYGITNSIKSLLQATSRATSGWMSS